jgi:two-component system sensor histidine kinase KdpD
VALGFGLLIERFIGVQSISLVFLMSVLAAALSWGLLPSLFACLLSVLAFNFFFLPPLYTFTIADPENVVALFFFLIVAIIVSNLTVATRRQICRRAAGLRPQASFTRSAASLPGSVRLTICCGRPPTRYRRCSMRTVLLLPNREGQAGPGIRVAAGRRDR